MTQWEYARFVVQHSIDAVVGDSGKPDVTVTSKTILDLPGSFSEKDVDHDFRVMDTVRELGRDGWELVTNRYEDTTFVNTPQRAEQGTHSEFVFKRPIGA